MDILSTFVWCILGAFAFAVFCVLGVKVHKTVRSLHRID
jgi:hypothetical protein